MMDYFHLPLDMAHLANAAAATNTAIVTDRVFDENQSTVTDIYLATVARGIDTFTLTQLEDLWYIANQCPIAGGPAVYMAWDMFSLFDETNEFDARENCDNAGILYMVRPNENAAQTSEAAKLFIMPNPANQSTKILWQTNHTVGQHSLHISHPSGAEATAPIQLNGVSGTVTLPVSHLASGIYIATLHLNGKPIALQRLVVVH